MEPFRALVGDNLRNRPTYIRFCSVQTALIGIGAVDSRSWFALCFN